MLWITDQLLHQRGHLFHWVPVMFGLGIALYFAIRFEPDPATWMYLAVLFAVVLAVTPFISFAYQPIAIALCLLLLGLGAAKVRTHVVSEPVLSFRYYGPIEGRVVKLDRSASDAVRVTLDQPVLFNLSPSRTPDRIRVSIHGDQPLKTILPGDQLIMTGHLSPPAGPAEPSGFDFQRHAWFAGLGAVGYTRTPVLRAAAPAIDRKNAIFRWRFSLSRYIRTRMPDETGAFATAIITGDRSAISQEVMADLRAANLAHLLAISGLHMGLLTGLIFTLIRFVTALIPQITSRFPSKKIAAVGALIIGAIYLALSGGNVATIRAYIMVGVMFFAIILDRRALTLRAVAIAAMIILVFQPEALTGPGFQMSFAATTALVFVFGTLRQLPNSQRPKWMRNVFSVVISSAVAGLATAPFAAAHFNLIAHFGLIANVFCVPIMGAIVMPAAVLSAILFPVGLEGFGFQIMDYGLRWILFVAQEISDLDRAISNVVAPGEFVLGAIAFGLLFVILWQGRLRSLGLLLAMSGFLSWGLTKRPELLIADNAALIGILTSEGRALSKPKGSGFVAGIWLENDGTSASQEEAADLLGIHRVGRTSQILIGLNLILHVTGKTALAELVGCNGADILISNQRVEIAMPCLVIDIIALRKRGALAFWLEEGNLRIETAREVTGVRPWNATAYRDDVVPFPILSK